METTIRTVITQEAYPPEILEKIRRGRNHLILIANRWMMGWPERVETLIQTGDYWTVLTNQVEMEIDALVESAQAGEKNLAPWEIMEQAGISPAPPVP